MKLIKICFPILFLLLSIASCSGDKKITFRGIAIDDTNGSAGLRNPERGLRLEVAVDIIRDKENPLKRLREQAEMYQSDSITLVQSYFYLTNVIGKDLTDENFAVMQSFFDELERLGMKSVLRFAYERDFMGREAVGPTLDQALTHLDQLKPFLEKNKHLIYVVQAGVIGAWGEWHASVHGLEKSDGAKTAILKKLLEVVPEGRAVQIRVPEFKNLLKNEPELYSRLSFHDDMIVIKPHEWDGNMHEGTPFFDQIVAESPFLPVDGELPWGFWSINQDPDSPETGWLIDGHEAARRFYLQHFSSLSAIHNYLEIRGRGDKKDEIKYSMQVWQETSIDQDFLKKENMPVSANYFETKDGKKVDRSAFDYIRDHLGYRIELQDLTTKAIWERNEANKIQLKLINRGFSTIFNEHDVYFVLLNDKDEVIASKTSADVFLWQPYSPQDASKKTLIHTIDHSFTLPADIPNGSYKLGLWIPDGSDQLKLNLAYAIRCANGDINWYKSTDGKYGINILTTIDVK